jgi:hypothetical protein
MSVLMEQEILQLLRQSPGQPFSIKEISKLLDRQQYREDPNWSRPFLQSLLARHLAEKDDSGRYLIAQA